MPLALYLAGAFLFLPQQPTDHPIVNGDTFISASPASIPIASAAAAEPVLSRRLGILSLLHAVLIPCLPMNPSIHLFTNLAPRWSIPLACSISRSLIQPANQH